MHNAAMIMEVSKKHTLPSHFINSIEHLEKAIIVIPYLVLVKLYSAPNFGVGSYRVC